MGRSLLVGPNLHPSLPQGGADDGKKIGKPGPVHKQGLTGVAGGRVVRLRVYADGYRLPLVGIAIDINGAETIGMAKYRNTCRLLDGLHELIGAPGNDQVDPAVELEQLAHLFTGRDKLNRVGRDALHLAESGLDGSHEDLVGPRGLMPSLENDGIGRFQGEGGYLHGGLGARLEDDADHSQRTAHPVELEPLIQPRGQGHPADRIRQPGHIRDPGQHGLELAAFEIAPLEQGAAQAAGFPLRLAIRLVGAVCLQDVFTPLLELAPHRLERGILHLS